jgi:uncharacterized protein (TIGR02246 family)
MSSRPKEMAAKVPVAAAGHHSTRPSAPGHRPVRPIPEVIAKAKPFRFARSLQEVPADAPIATTAWQTTPTTSSTGPDIAGITSMMRSYLQAFNRHDPAALAAHWSTAAENVDLDSGETTAGREAVREVFTALFEQDAGATIDIDIGSIRPLRDDVAVVDGVSRISFTDAPPSSSRFSAVLVRQAGNWVLDTVRESNASLPHAASESLPTAPSRPLDALAWLVGSWEDVAEGVTASTHCFWSTNKAFLIRTHVVSSDAAQEHRPAPGDSRIPGLLPAGPTGNREITEIIGWDDDRGQIRSWLFTSDGRFAEGSWSQEGNAWTVRIEAAATARTDDCLYTLTRMDDDEMACRCTSDRLADILPPACDYHRTARAGAPAASEIP